VSVLAATTSPSTFWYLTRGSGVVALLLLTASLCLGIGTTLRWGGNRFPRFAVAGLHRSITLLAIVFVALHVTTTALDRYAPIGWKDAFVPFASPYRPVWLGLGAVAFDLLLALVLTSLLRARLGYRLWRATHWLAYASWPLALVHSLGTGSDARVGWMQALALGSALAVCVTLALRLAQSAIAPGRRVGAALTATVLLLGVGVWYEGGPGAHGWAARAGTPVSLLPHTVALTTTAKTEVVLTKSFRARLVGQLTQTAADANGLVSVRIDSTLVGTVRGTLRLVLQGIPADGGGVSMTANGVAFALAGSPDLYEGQIVGLQGTQIAARVTAASGRALELQIALNIKAGQTRVSGTVDGTPV
jgi:sulfoxide reductase heme-binding subunit YedZ